MLPEFPHPSIYFSITYEKPTGAIGICNNKASAIENALPGRNHPLFSLLRRVLLFRGYSPE